MAENELLAFEEQQLCQVRKAEELRVEVQRLKTLLSKSVRVEMVDFPDGRGCRFIVGEDHVVAEWRSDGIAADTIFVEEPVLTYFKTTSPLDRCVRMTMEMVHWEVVCAMLAGPGDGKLVEWAEKYPNGLNGDDDDE